MNVIYLILLIAAAICFLLAAAGQAVHPRVNLIAAGLFLWVLVPLIMQAKSM